MRPSKLLCHLPSRCYINYINYKLSAIFNYHWYNYVTLHVLSVFRRKMQKFQVNCPLIVPPLTQVKDFAFPDSRIVPFFAISLSLPTSLKKIRLDLLSISDARWLAVSRRYKVSRCGAARGSVGILTLASYLHDDLTVAEVIS